MNIEIFKNEEFGELTILEEDGKQFIEATGVAKILGYINPQKAIRDHCREGGITIRSVGVQTGIKNDGNPAIQYVNKNFIDEGNLYRLIASSKMPNAEKFERWIFDEVLPTIRKTGGYVANDQLFIDTYLPFADDITKKLFSSTLEIVKNQNRLIGEMKPKVDYFDKLVDRNLLTNFRDTAKELNISPKEFNEYLVQSRYIYRDKKGKLKPYQPHVKNGLFELKEYYNHYSKHVDTQTLITPKGRETFRLLFQ